MTTPFEVASLTAAGVRFEVVDGRLRVDAPVGILTPADRAALTAHRDALIDHLILDSLEADGTAARLRATWATLSHAERERLQAEADDGDRLAELIQAALWHEAKVIFGGRITPGT